MINLINVKNETKIDGSKYEGEFKNDEYEGHGIKVFSNGEKYEGEFHKGNMHGKGILYSLNGINLEGTWNFGKKNGIFKKTAKDGKISTIEYKDNIKISDKSPVEYWHLMLDSLNAQEKEETINNYTEYYELPYEFWKMDYFDFLEMRRKLMAQSIRKYFEKL